MTREKLLSLSLSSLFAWKKNLKDRKAIDEIVVGATRRAMENRSAQGTQVGNLATWIFLGCA